MVSTLVSICFSSPRLGDIIKTSCMKLQIIDREICPILVFLKNVYD